LRCKDFEERISAFLDHELSKEETALVQRHMMRCDDCRGAIDGVRQIRATLQGLGALAAPAPFQLRIAECLQEGMDRSSLWARSLVMGLALMAAVAIVLWPEGGPTQPAQSASPPTRWAEQARIWALPAAGSDVSMRFRAAPANGARYSHARMRLASF
jgi:anti-sigma factor RsiW